MSLTYDEANVIKSESLYDVIRVPVKHVPEIWKYVSSFLDRSIEVNPLMSLDQIIEGIGDESIQMWIVSKTSEHDKDLSSIAAVFLTSIEKDDSDWVLSLYNLVGQEARNWVQICHETMHRFARLHECKRVRLCGRKAWQRILPGYAVTGEKGGHLIYERPVE